MAKRKSKPVSQEPEIVRRDGALCVTFVNTVSTERPALETYADLLAWGRRSGALTPSQAERLGRVADGEPDQARAVLTRAQTLRGCLLSIFHAIAEGGSPADFDVEALDHSLYEVLAHRRLIAADDGRCQFVWREGDELDRMLWPVLTSATRTLTSKHCREIRECASEGCSLMFLDRSSGSPRKWCSQKTCGHRDRSRRHYRKTVKTNRARAEEASRRKKKRKES
ncbi:MAG: CGNR zinc finger domain-containing protein [Thermoanaerobaculia bacterium]